MLMKFPESGVDSHEMFVKSTLPMNVDWDSNTSWLQPPADTVTPMINNSLMQWAGGCFQVMTVFLGCLGMVTNVINILVFIRQGLTSDSSTVGLFTLAIADFFGCLTGIPQPLCLVTQWAMSQHIFLICSAFSGGIFTSSHLMLSRITCWLTVYIAVERCLAVLLPFKVKSLLNPKTAALAATVIYTLVLGAYMFFFSHFRISWVVMGNGSRAVFHLAPPGITVNYYLSLSFNTILTSAAFIIIIVTTCLMMYKLRASIRFREKTSCQGQGQKAPEKAKGEAEPGAATKARGRREMEVLKTVTMVTALFLVCLSMSHIPGFVLLLMPEVHINGVNANLYGLAFYYKILFDVINSSLNYFFYIRFSSRYRAAFDQIFRKSSACPQR